ncbi:MAG TPA: FUSC family membrane protein [Hanamia sp.]|nr:FUSC family membrane protein [Hanamia sp.]
MQRLQKIKYFLFSQYFADGIRITLEIIIPAFVFSSLGKMGIGLDLSLGALCVSVADGPGPIVHKRNGMLYCNIFIFISALLTGLLNHNILLLGVFILASSFFFTMFSVYGNRANSIGFAALLIMVLQMTEVAPFYRVFTESLLILFGGIWYMAIALLLFQISPHRPAQRALGDCIRETAKYLLIKSEMYNLHTDIEENYRKLIDQQIIVNEKQDTVRELLFKNRALLKESTHIGRVLVLTFVDAVDLFEHIMASWYDYSSLRKKYASTGILDDVSIVVKNLAKEMNNIGEAIQAGNSYKKELDLTGELNIIKKRIDTLPDIGSSFMLKKILVNLRNLGEKTDGILKYFKEEIPEEEKLRSRKEYSRFVTHQKINGSVFKNNLTFQSSIFRHSIRMMIACSAGFIISKWLPHGNHSYWIVMTIIIILKPSFSLTKKKNSDRLLGTIGGGIIGFLMLYFIKDNTVLFVLIIFFMLGTYTFKTHNYVVMVIFLTPYILILFHFLGQGSFNVVSQRFVDTAIGSALAFLASYFLFPQWESGQLKKYMENVLKANINYLQKLKNIFTGNKISSLEYKLTRKELLVSTANLSAAMNRMLSEPKSKQSHRKAIYEFVVLNNVLSSNIASITATTYNDEKYYPKEYINLVNKSISILEKNLHQLNESFLPEEDQINTVFYLKTNNFGETILKEQLDFIYKITTDISKITNAISS